MGVTHTFVSAIADDPAAAAAGQVLPSHWNAGHTVSVSMAEINATGTPSASNFLRGDGSWQSVTTSPAGSDTYVQFNDGGAFGAEAGFAYNKTTNTLSSEKLALGTAGAAAGVLTLSGSTSGTVTLQPAAAAGTYSLTLPTSDGNSGEVLTTDGSGVLSWAASAGGSPGGSNTQLQYNNAGAFGGTSGITTTGTELTIASGTKTASTPVLDITQTWNNAAVTFTGLKFNVTNTASAAASLLMDLQVAGSSKFKIDRNGVPTVPEKIEMVPGLSGYGINYCTGGASNIGGHSGITSQGLLAGSSSPVAWNSGTSVLGALSLDLYLYRDAANTLAQRNGTNAQTLRVYNTYTDASNYERAKIAWDTNVLKIGTEKAGTGTARALELQTDGTTRMTFASGSSTIETTQNITIRTGGGQSLSFDYSSSVSRNGANNNLQYTTHSAASHVFILGSTTYLTLNSTALTLSDAVNIAVGTTTGTKIGTATTQKLGFWNATPIVQPTTAGAAATVAATGTGDVVAASTTFDGYTIPQIVKALRNAGLLA